MATHILLLHGIYRQKKQDFLKGAVRVSFPPVSWGTQSPLIGQAVNKIIPAILPWAAWPIRGDCFPQENGGKLTLTALFRVFLSKFLCPFISEKKNCLDYRVHGIQNDRLNLTVSTQKLVLENMHRVPRYSPKCVKFCRFGLESRFWQFFGNIFVLCAYFSKPIFALKPWDWAGRFEYHALYKKKNFFTYKGAEKCWGSHHPS